MTDASPARYRDWDNLRYWFRAVEMFAPWVNNIWFVTWGHLPEWMNTRCPKLHIINHRDYIPSQYLPTFSANPIELNLHRIEGLAEQFVYFNDDMFLGRELSPERFFRRGLPCDIARLSIIRPGNVAHIVLNDINVINRRYSKNDVIGLNPFKWFAPRYGMRNLLKTLSLMPWSTFAGLKDTHMPQPYLKSTFEKMWKQERDLLDATCRNRFRSALDVNQWLMRYEQLASGEFTATGDGDTKLDELGDKSIDEITHYIRKRKFAMFCLNDSNEIEDFETVKNKLNEAFAEVFNEKSRYEV